MPRIKYVVVKMHTGGVGKKEVIVVFPEFVEHKQMAERLVISERHILSGGFCYMPDALNPEPSCFGESVSLNKKSRPEDTELLKRMIANDW